VKENAGGDGEQETEAVTEPQTGRNPADGILDSIDVRPATGDSDAEGKEEALPIRRRTSPKVIISKPQLAESENSLHDTVQTDNAPASTKETELHTPSTHLGTAASTIPATEQANEEESPTSKIQADNTDQMSRSNKKQRGKKSGKPSLGKHANVQLKEGTGPGLAKETKSTPATASKKAHIRFDSEEPAEPERPTSANSYGRVRYGEEERSEPIPPQHVENDDDGDSDEAPEEVTAASALTKTKAATADAARAYRAQQEKEKLKRKERAERIADEQMKKRKKDEKKMKKLTRMESRDQEVKHLDVDIHNLPALLPDSILEAAGDRRPPTPPPMLPGMTTAEKRQEKLNRHIKFLERGEKPIKDVKKGSLNVRVLGQQNPVLPPKVNRDTKGIREHWLKGREAKKRHASGKKNKKQVTKMERAPFGGGFIRSKD
jgi:hypothetical protein